MAVGLPLISFVFSLLTPSRYAWLTALNAPILLLVSAICAVILLINRWGASETVLHIKWFSIHTHSFSANLLLSDTTLLMLTVVSVISFLVHLYSAGYMAGDAQLKKYFAMLGFFTFSMLGIVLSDNLLVMFVFWELVGFSSFMLIGHWSEKPAAGSAAKKAFVMNRIGDAGFLIGLMIIWTNSGTFNLSEILPLSGSIKWETAASLFIFCGVIGKSAQFPLFTWLADAMEGPTPVSALMHAATMVAAGVYLLIRISTALSDDALTFIACTGMVTALIGSMSALFQFDIKKILAYSTISQLGLMVMAIGLGVTNAALLHLFTHAFFKACLFLSAGAVIHALHDAQLRSREHFDVQDIRNMGGLRKKLPVTFFTFILGGASLAGIPFFSGFLSKEAILSALWMNNNMLSWFMMVVMLLVSFVTVLYTIRMIWYIFMGEERKTATLDVHEVPMVMRIPTIVLALSSVWLVVSLNPFDAIGWLLPEKYFTHLPWLTAFSVVWIALAVVVAYLTFRKARFYSNAILENAFFLDVFYQRLFSGLANKSASAALFTDRKLIDGFIHSAAYSHVVMSHITGWFDRAIIDGLVNGLASFSRILGSFTRSFHGGKIQSYIFWAIFAIIIFLIWSLN